MFKKLSSLTVVICFFLTSLGPLPRAHADTVLGLPALGTMVNLSPAYEPVMIKGLTVHKDNPFLFDFIVDVGQDRMSGEPLKKEGEKLIKYFLASLAIPDKDVWVNLSPYEKNKIIPDALGQTDMGRDLLEQDYILKQITASLIYPEKKLGKEFWNRVYAKAQEQYGTTQIPVNTFNKVWIMADRAEVFEHNQTAFVVDSHLKVMLEEDYLALSRHSEGVHSTTEESKGVLRSFANTQDDKTHSIASQIVKQIILPELEKEINTGKNFANLRQIFNSVILSSWYKRNLKEALLNQLYADKSKVKGINLNDPTVKERIYEQYLKAYKKGVFNYIKEDVNAANGQSMPRKYFSGGISRLSVPNLAMTSDPAALAKSMDRNPMVDFTTLAATEQNQNAPSEFSIGYSLVWNSSIKEAHEQTDAAMSWVGFTFSLLGAGAGAYSLWTIATYNTRYSYKDINEYRIKLRYFRNRSLRDFDLTKYKPVIDEGSFAKYKGVTVKEAYVFDGTLKYRQLYPGNTIPKERAGNLPDDAMTSNGHMVVVDGKLVYEDSEGNRFELTYHPKGIVLNDLPLDSSQKRIKYFDIKKSSTRRSPVTVEIKRSRAGAVLAIIVYPDNIIPYRRISISGSNFRIINAAMASAVKFTYESPNFDIQGSYGVKKTPIVFNVPRKQSVRWDKKEAVIEFVSLGPDRPETRSSGEINDNKYKIVSMDGQPIENGKELNVTLRFASSSDEKIFWRIDEESLIKALNNAAMNTASASLNGEGAYTYSVDLRSHPQRISFSAVGSGISFLVSNVQGDLLVDSDYDEVSQEGNILTVVLPNNGGIVKGELDARGELTLTAPVDLGIDAAMTGSQHFTRGGIDLNTSNGMQWKIAKDGQGVEMNIDPAMIARIQREGISSLSPVILKITPVTSVWPLVGLQAPAAEEHLA